VSEGDVALGCVSILVDELARAGVEHACVSPGSRSTPIALALARDPRMRVHVHLDERASGFFALGTAKATGRPAAVACTSGTAAANLWPAVVESSQSRTPLILLTADRPPELRGTGANQTIDQAGLYGSYARWFAEAPLPAERDGAAWRALGKEAAARLLRYPRGPVHVNLPFREPLVPEGTTVGLDDPGPTGAEADDETGAPSDDDAARLASAIAGVERGLVVIGEMRAPAEKILALARASCWPVLAEPISLARRQGWALAAGQALVSCNDWLEAHRPEVVLQVGAVPSTRAAQALVGSVDRLLVLDHDHLDPDPEHRAAVSVRADPDATAALVMREMRARAPSDWYRDWRSADAVARKAMDELVDSWEEPFEGRVARDLAALVPAGGVLAVGSSMPIRDLDFFMAPREGTRILANRGASGIDGFVSTVLGIAATGPPTFALCGDLTLLHDAGALLWSARRGLNALLVVPNNDGGGVFSFLPQRELPEHEELFVTPHGLDLARFAEAAGAGYERVEKASELVPAVSRGTAGGVRLVEVPSDRDRNVARHAEVQAAVGRALRVV